jgi:4-amino-4-deoxy-L-arabinose transferase-like glycosyltransferase
MTQAISPPTPLCRADYFILAGVCVLLFGYTLLDRRVLTMHEAVLPENSREMMLDHDWLVPRYGGLPWLERPPLPQWITVAVASVAGSCDQEWIVRLPPACLALVVVLLVATMTSWWYGRGIGLLTGLILATMSEFYTYASDTEPDMFLCAIVTGTIMMFVQLEFRRRREGESVHFLGRRPWSVLAFFLLLGATNLAKGLIFGTIMAGVPIAGFLLWNRNLRAIGRYVWLWGWLAFAVVALTWPLLILRQYPEARELWASDYLGRLNKGFVREPVWYYLEMLPQVMLPWSLPALLGLVLTARPAVTPTRAGTEGTSHGSRERFLWCWAVLTPLVFTIPQGKHHHYLLQCLAPWAVLSALGARRIWQWVLQEAPALLRNPVFYVLALAVPLDVALAVSALKGALGAPLATQGWMLGAVLALCPAGVLLLSFGLTRPSARAATALALSGVVVGYCLLWSYKTHYYDRYREDQEFLRQTRQLVPHDQPILVNHDDHTLEGFRALFYLGSNAKLLHNFTYLLSDQITQPEVYVLARGKHAATLARYGTARVVLQSRHTRGETSQGDRWTLFSLRFRDGLQRRPESVAIGPMQATGRMRGPFLE